MQGKIITMRLLLRIAQPLYKMLFLNKFKNLSVFYVLFPRERWVSKALLGTYYM